MWFLIENFSEGLARYEDSKTPAGATPVAKEGDVPKPKKFFKSRDPPETPPATYSSAKSDQNYGGASKKQRNNSYSSSSPEREVVKTAPGTKKFFSSKNNCATTEKTVLGSNVNNVKRAETKPPIVLRICRGKCKYTIENFLFFLLLFKTALSN